MSSHLSGEEAGCFRRRAMSAAELLRADDHLAECAACRDAIAAADDVASLTAMFADDDISHLDYEQLAACVDGSASAIDREIVETHVADCALCRRELRDLQKFASAPDRRRRWWLGAAAAAAIVAAAIVVPLERERPVVSLHDGGREVTLRRDGRLTGLPPQLTAAQQRDIARALTGGQLPAAPAIGPLRGTKQTLLGATTTAAAELQPIAPLGCIVVDDRPTLEWSPLPGVTHYRAELFDSHFQAVAAGDVLRATRWTVDVPLRRGETYVWQVTGFANDREVTAPAPPAPMARFAVLDASRARTIGRLMAQLPPSHLALGIAYAEAGALPDAEREFRALVDENRDSDSAQRLLESVRTSTTR
jgi:hypothetical protein